MGIIAVVKFNKGEAIVFFIGSKTINNINELDIPKVEKDILLSIFGKKVKSCCVKKSGEVYIENEKCINYLYKYTS